MCGRNAKSVCSIPGVGVWRVPERGMGWICRVGMRSRRRSPGGCFDWLTGNMHPLLLPRAMSSRPGGMREYLEVRCFFFPPLSLRFLSYILVVVVYFFVCRSSILTLVFFSCLSRLRYKPVILTLKWRARCGLCNVVDPGVMSKERE
ncbi:hypothetical protein GALMADRAFT_1134367 [Galerina marginata CBS 339.88]|uniref:Transmembrane protein n=1 Tax=Galerina marginata (strain CBS 339.88) TaxID=685588 RepID=A0A067S8B5_GALM3|nr:hypothetical protein GALMADRAFT_1134367 [Galerina marginata CBS 339.88]